MLNNNGRFRSSAILPIFSTVPGFDTKKKPLNTMKLYNYIIITGSSLYDIVKCKTRFFHIRFEIIKIKKIFLTI